MRFFRYLIYSLLLLLLLIGVTIFYFQRKEINKNLFVKQIIPNHESLTELYFSDHNNLPKHFIPDQPYPFSFSIHNIEGKRFTYQYEIVLASENSYKVIRQGKITLENTATQKIDTLYTVPWFEDKTQVSVNLLNKKQTIHFNIDPVIDETSQ